MIIDLGFCVAFEIKETKLLGKIAIIDNNIDTFNNRQIIELNQRRIS